VLGADLFTGGREANIINIKAQTKIRKHRAVCAKQDVAWLDIPMRNSPLVEHRERIEQRTQDLERGRPSRAVSSGNNSLVKRPTIEPGHYDKRQIFSSGIVGEISVDNARKIGVTMFRRDPRFTAKPVVSIKA
jgi:hypothetical protein